MATLSKVIIYIVEALLIFVIVFALYYFISNTSVLKAKSLIENSTKRTNDIVKKYNVTQPFVDKGMVRRYTLGRKITLENYSKVSGQKVQINVVYDSNSNGYYLQIFYNNSIRKIRMGKVGNGMYTIVVRDYFSNEINGYVRFSVTLSRVNNNYYLYYDVSYDSLNQ